MSHTKRADELTDPRFQGVWDSQDLEEITDYFGLKETPTGALVIAAESDYDEVWLTYSSRPYDFRTMYEKIEKPWEVNDVENS